jgi:[protein-PII] uridylyltransferase
MSDDQVKVLEHARRELEAVAGHESPHLLPLYQKFLKIENYRLRLRHQGGGGGREVCASRASLIDVLLRHIFTFASSSAMWT